MIISYLHSHPQQAPHPPAQSENMTARAKSMVLCTLLLCKQHASVRMWTPTHRAHTSPQPARYTVETALYTLLVWCERDEKSEWAEMQVEWRSSCWRLLSSLAG